MGSDAATTTSIFEQHEGKREQCNLQRGQPCPRPHVCPFSDQRGKQGAPCVQDPRIIIRSTVVCNNELFFGIDQPEPFSGGCGVFFSRMRRGIRRVILEVDLARTMKTILIPAPLHPATPDIPTHTIAAKKTKPIIATEPFDREIEGSIQRDSRRNKFDCRQVISPRKVFERIACRVMFFQARFVSLRQTARVHHPLSSPLGRSDTADTPSHPPGFRDLDPRSRHRSCPQQEKGWGPSGQGPRASSIQFLKLYRWMLHYGRPGGAEFLDQHKRRPCYPGDRLP